MVSICVFPQSGKQGAGMSTGVPKPVNMVAVNLGQTKSNMINFKISNGQIQADHLQPMDGGYCVGTGVGVNVFFVFIILCYFFYPRYCLISSIDYMVL